MYTHCQLGRSDLVSLFGLAAGHISAEHAMVTTMHNSTRWTAHSLPDLINDVTSNVGYDSRVPWDNVQFLATDPSGELQVEMTVGPQDVIVRVSGTNNILVHGQQARIELFLRNRGASHTMPKDEPSAGHLIVSASATTAMLMALVPVPRGSIWPILLIGCWMAVSVVTSATLAYSRRTRLKVLEDIPTGTAWNRFTPIEKFTVVGIYASVLAMTGTIATAINNIFK
ncbi:MULTISPECIES: hypothetical protein [unclassified Streptomyces]|uniref:hypothetical protein n=1 Tax=Streptomyces TaxID=1883 RepID=UPI000B8408C3|nr:MULTISPECIES: hypothetical protein [unclassified Streptomyces]